MKKKDTNVHVHKCYALTIQTNIMEENKTGAH